MNYHAKDGEIDIKSNYFRVLPEGFKALWKNISFSNFIQKLKSLFSVSDKRLIYVYNAFSNSFCKMHIYRKKNGNHADPTFSSFLKHEYRCMWNAFMKKLIKHTCSQNVENIELHVNFPQNPVYSRCFQWYEDWLKQKDK